MCNRKIQVWLRDYSGWVCTPEYIDEKHHKYPYILGTEDQAQVFSSKETLIILDFFMKKSDFKKFIAHPLKKDKK
jgi:hypothetical protein